MLQVEGQKAESESQEVVVWRADVEQATSELEAGTCVAKICGFGLGAPQDAATLAAIRGSGVQRNASVFNSKINNFWILYSRK